MKTKISLFVLLILSFLCVILLVSCGEDECLLHTDGDGNYFCDECGAELERPDEPCTECVDEDGDLMCDVCGEEITDEKPETEPPVCQHTDKNFDGKCDDCQLNMPGALPLVSEGKTAFTFVVGEGINGDSMMLINNLAKEIKNLGVEIKTVTDKTGTVGENEILFGEISARDEEYRLDSHEYGMKGYAVRIIENKIVVKSGSTSSFADAIAVLRTQIFGITDKTVRLVNRYVYPEQSVSVVQNDYKVNKITLCGEDIRSFSIATDKKNSDALAAATSIQSLLYEKCGYWLEIVDSAEAQRAIFINLVGKTGGEGFYATFTEGKIVFNVEYITSIKKDTYSYFADKLGSAEGTLAFDASSSFTKNVRDVFYKDFGAVGDGVTNDAAAILAAHRYANEGGHQKVIAESGKTYYIGKISAPIVVRSSVDWTGAKFIIDDTVVAAGTSTDIFSVEAANTGNLTFTSKNSEVIKEINDNGGIKRDSITKIDLGLGYPAMLQVNNSAHKNYIRYGANANSGEMQTELILVDAEGNIDPTTPFMFDYEKITSISVYRSDFESVTLKGGEFTTVANNKNSSYYYSRGIFVTRPNVTIDGVKHYVVGEGEKGAPYSHFVKLIYSSDILFENCVFTAHKTYYNSQGVGIGSYDINVDKCINVIFRNCTQTNFFKEDGSLADGFWGVMASGQAKNITYDSCTLTRFDAHEGVWNATIKNSNIRHIRLVGGGTFRLENSHVYNFNVISMREDYGAFWIGDIILKDVTVHTNSNVNLIDGKWYNHDFGYKTVAPQNIVVEGIKIEGKETTVNIFSANYINLLNKSVLDEFTSINSETGAVTVTPNKNKVTPTKTITVYKTEGITFVYPEKTAFFKDTVITEE